MNPATFLKNSERIVTGYGFKKAIPISLYGFHLQSSGAALTTTLTTNPGYDKLDTNMTGLSWAAAKVVEAGLQITVPRDYDESQDNLKLRFKAKMSGATDTPKLDAKAYKDDAGTTDLDPTISAALSDSLAWVEIDISGESLQGGDVLQIAVFPEAHGTDAVEVYAIELEYSSCLVYFDQDNRSQS